MQRQRQSIKAAFAYYNYPGRISTICNPEIYYLEDVMTPNKQQIILHLLDY